MSTDHQEVIIELLEELVLLQVIIQMCVLLERHIFFQKLENINTTYMNMAELILHFVTAFVPSILCKT